MTATGAAVFRRLHDACNSGDQDLIRATIDEVVAPDVVIRTPLPIDATGPAALKEVFTRLVRAFPDLHIETEDLITAGDKVVARNTVTGTHQGEYLGIPPTGKAVTYNEIFIFRVADAGSPRPGPSSTSSPNCGSWARHQLVVTGRNRSKCRSTFGEPATARPRTVAGWGRARGVGARGTGEAP